MLQVTYRLSCMNRGFLTLLHEDRTIKRRRETMRNSGRGDRDVRTPELVEKNRNDYFRVSIRTTIEFGVWSWQLYT